MSVFDTVVSIQSRPLPVIILADVSGSMHEIGKLDSLKQIIYILATILGSGLAAESFAQMAGGYYTPNGAYHDAQSVGIRYAGPSSPVRAGVAQVTNLPPDMVLYQKMSYDPAAYNGGYYTEPAPMPDDDE